MKTSPSHWWDPPSAALFMLAVLVSVWRLTVTDWTDNLGYVINLAAAAAILGLALGASRFGKRAVRWLALGYTLIFIPRQLAAYYESDVYLGERLAGVGGRLLFSLSEFAANQPVKDPIFFIALMGALYWFIALVSACQLARHNNTLAALLPAGLAMLVIHHFDPGPTGRTWMIGLYFFAALTLIGRGKYLRDRAGWMQRGVHLAPETGSDLGMGALIGAAALILLAWNMPLNLTGMHALESQWQEITRPWRGARDRLGRAFDALEGHNAPAERVEYFQSALPLGSRAAQGSTLVFKVSALPEATELPRLYWRARVYDHYENGGWSESQTVTSKLSPTEAGLSIPDRSGRQEYEFAITSYSQGQAVLNLPAQPLWVSRPADVTAFPLADGTQDVLFLQTFPFLEPGETYRVRAAMANPSIQELRAAGQDYPDWVKARYLQLPADFSDRVRRYASQVTFGQNTPYEQAQAITGVLRSQIEYQPNLTLPPPGTDIMEWFLFEGRKGYCNYYATAETLMLRSLGVPARLAVGFAQGEATEGAQRPGETEVTEQVFSVYLKHMHAWPEIYFPGIGWVEFEPTGNQPALVRPAAPRADLQPAAPPEAGQPPPLHRPDLEPEETGDKTGTLAVLRHWLTPLLWTASLLLGAVVLRGCYAFADRKYALATRAAEYVLVAAERRGERGPAWVKNVALYVLANPFERAFHPVNLGLRWLGESPAAHLTPAERAESLSARLPEAAGEIEILLKEYHASQYARRGGNLPGARRAGRRLLWLGLRAAIGQRVRMIK